MIFTTTPPYALAPPRRELKRTATRPDRAGIDRRPGDDDAVGLAVGVVVRAEAGAYVVARVGRCACWRAGRASGACGRASARIVRAARALHAVVAVEHAVAVRGGDERGVILASIARSTVAALSSCSSRA